MNNLCDVGETSLSDFNKIPYVKLNEDTLPNIIEFKTFLDQIKQDVTSDQQANREAWKIDLDSLDYEIFHKKLYRQETLTGMFMTLKLPEDNKFNKEKLKIYKAHPDIEKNIKTFSAKAWAKRSEILIPLYKELFARIFADIGFQLADSTYNFFSSSPIIEAFNDDDVKLVNLQVLKQKAVEMKINAWSLLGADAIHAQFLEDNADDFREMTFGEDDNIDNSLFVRIGKALEVEYEEYFPEDTPFARMKKGEEFSLNATMDGLNLIHFNIFYKCYRTLVLGSYVERYMSVVQNMDMLQNAGVANLSVSKNFLTFKMYLMINGYLELNVVRDKNQLGTMDYNWIEDIISYRSLI